MNPNSTAVGTCSRCGGRVSVPTIWHGITPPTPQCESCGATAAPNHGPIIPMDPPVKTYITSNFEIKPDTLP